MELDDDKEELQALKEEQRIQKNNSLIQRLIKINRKMQKGYNEVSWILNVILGTSLVSYVLTGLKLIIFIPGTVLPFLVAGSYYWLGSIHEKNDNKKV
jgi:hypothetical protein